MNIEKHLRPSFTYKKGLFKLFDPLFKKTQLSYVGYNRYYDHNKWSGLYSDPNLVGSVLEKGYYPIFNSNKGFILTDGTYYATDAKDLLISAASDEKSVIDFFKPGECQKAHKLKIQGLYFFRTNLYYRESFFFSTNEDFDSLKVYYTDLIPELKIFCSHFLYKAREAIQHAEICKDVLTFPVAQKDKSSYSSSKEAQKMLKQTKYCIPTELGDVFLSHQERVCLYYLSRGFTYPEIACEMNLQKRTVENYINNVKNKANLNTRADLVNLEKHLAFFS